MSLAVIALVGRPNVGKSTLFNCITKRRDALVADMPGVTRDRIYGEAVFNDKRFIVVDTGGLSEDKEGIAAVMAEQSWQAATEADAIFFIVDARAGLTPDDQKIAKVLRALSKPLVLVVNKTDGLDAETVCNEFYQLGLGEPVPIAASHARNVKGLLESHLPKILATLSAPSELNQPEPGIKIALIGRPNVGKSTLTNRMLGEDRVVVFDMPGTTRDSIYVPMERHGEKYTLIDTAGVRRKGRVEEGLEKFSVIKTLQAIENAHVVLMLFDAQEGITEQDLHILGFALDAGRGLVIAVNKWDDLDQNKRDMAKAGVDRRLNFVEDFVEVHFISALHGSNVGNLFAAVHRAYDSSNKKLDTPELTRTLEQAVLDHNPPLVRGRRVKLRYAHSGGHNPPVIVVHGNQVEHLPDAYKRYLMNYFRSHFKLIGTPIRMQFKSSENPFAGKKNELSPRQAAKRRRLKQHIKKSKK